MSPVAVHTIVQIDMKSKNAKVYPGDSDFIEFCSNEDCVVLFKDESVFGLATFELWKEKPRALEVLAHKKTKWHAVPMKDFTREVTARLPLTESCPQDPPVGG